MCLVVHAQVEQFSTSIMFDYIGHVWVGSFHLCLFCTYAKVKEGEYHNWRNFVSKNFVLVKEYGSETGNIFNIRIMYSN